MSFLASVAAAAADPETGKSVPNTLLNNLCALEVFHVSDIDSSQKYTLCSARPAASWCRVFPICAMALCPRVCESYVSAAPRATALPPPPPPLHHRSSGTKERLATSTSSVTERPVRVCHSIVRMCASAPCASEALSKRINIMLPSRTCTSFRVR